MDSQAIVNTMEVLETKPLTDLVTEATVKVCYVSELPNPNNTVITKEIGREIGATLPGAPVVGLFDSEANDFVEHSRRLNIKNGEIKWEELTRPYGFVSPIHQPWYQDFIEHGEVRTYLMCKAFLWTRQYKEASLIKDKGQSMELNETDMSGYYEGDVFIFTHATLDKLCILGDEYAPCFEGAKFMTTYAKSYNALAEEVETIIGRRYYVLNNELVEKPASTTLTMENENTVIETEEVAATEFTTQELATEAEVATETTVEVTAEIASEGVIDSTVVETVTNDSAKDEVANTEEISEVPATVESIENYVENTEAQEQIVEENSEIVTLSTEVTSEIVNIIETTEPASTEYTALNERIASLEQQIVEKDNRISELEVTLNEYRQRDAEAENQAKNEMVASYKSMLTDEEMKPVIDKLSDLSLDEVEAKLSVTYTRKQRSSTQLSSNGIQVNINAMDVEEKDVPEFMKQAAEYDRAHGLNIKL